MIDITPTRGRIVWFTPSAGDHGFSALMRNYGPEPFAAMIVHVWNDRMVNLVAYDPTGESHSCTSVTLLQGDDAKPEGGYFAQWMPYQKGQAAKADAVEPVKVRAAALQLAADIVKAHGCGAHGQHAGLTLNMADEFERYLTGGRSPIGAAIADGIAAGLAAGEGGAAANVATAGPRPFRHFGTGGEA